MEAAVREGLCRGCTAELDHGGQRLLLLLAGGRGWPAGKNGRDVAVEKHRRELDSVARQGASIKSIEPAAVLHDGVMADTIPSRVSEGCVGRLVPDHSLDELLLFNNE
jgi:hypothetical protein